jgi:lipoprotein-anchoring transpeptidase ErfK/SrfK
MESGMIGVNGPGCSAATARLLRLAVLTAAGGLGATGHAEAAFYYWSDYSDGSYYYRQQPMLPRHQPRKRTPVTKKDIPEKEIGAKPQGPLIIAISIEKQKLTVYDTKGAFAESPVSTGMRGHPTPMGVFSVIQKHKYHHSNIYSGAPMPYMQRITWSGVAMHAGVLPGYPASHGCIRMPMTFAVKMWNWTKMGARVIVTPGETAPSRFSHPLLAAFKVPPAAPSLEPQADAPVGAKADKGADKGASEIKTASSDAVVELRSTVGHGATMSDTTTGNALSRGEGTTPTEPTASSAQDVAKTESTVKTAEAKPQSEEVAVKTDDAVAAASGPAKSEPAKSELSDAGRKPDVAVTATTPITPAAPDARKDQTRLAEPTPAPAAKPEPPKRAGQIAVFISRKDSRLYVRQNFAPLFDVPVTIAPGDQPLGTHVFTAEVDKNDSNALSWSVVSLPVSVRTAEHEDGGRIARRQRVAHLVPVAARPAPTPNSPAEALDRIAVPADTMARINEMLTTGGSIIVSDQGINHGGETGQGTDFIVKLR